MVLCETMSTKACKLCMFHKLILQQATWLKERNSMCNFAVEWALVPTQEEKTICALVERIYLIIVSREGNHAQLELLSKIFESFNVMRCIPPPVCLWAWKGRYNLCMNRASLDRESWTNTTLLNPHMCISTISQRWDETWPCIYVSSGKSYFGIVRKSWNYPFQIW